MTEFLTHLNGWMEGVLGVIALIGVVTALWAGAYHGARKQAAASLKPLVGDPPMEVQVPLAQRLEELLWRLERQEERTLQTQREIGDIRDDVSRNSRDIEAGKEQTRGHEERLSRIERRVDNVERRCGMHNRADSHPPGSLA